MLESAAEQGLDASRVRRLGIPDAWIHQDSRGDQLRLAGVDAAGIAAAVRGVVEEAADAPGGVLTPASAFGHSIIERTHANAGLTFDVET